MISKLLFCIEHFNSSVRDLITICLIQVKWNKLFLSRITDWYVNRGGGVAFYFSLHYTAIDTSSIIEQQLWISVKTKNKRIVFGVVYRPPEFGYKVFINELENYMMFCMSFSKDVIYLGDCNIYFLV